MNAVDPRFVLSIFNGAYAAGADYLDMAMSLSQRHPEAPYELTWVKLGDEQFARANEWEKAGRLALVGMGVEPGLSDVFARYAADHLFSEIGELGTRDGSNLTVDGYERAFIFRTTFVSRGTVPAAVEGMSYGIPGYKLNGRVLLYFAAWKEHYATDIKRFRCLYPALRGLGAGP